jgi:ABC-type oligopeptide transport system substrate-binding subunit
VTKPPFDNKLLRQALAATIDREVMANVLLQGAAYPAYSFFPNGTPAYDAAWRLPPRNVALAKEKLWPQFEKDFGKELQAVRGVSFALQKGEAVSIVGESE